MQLSDLTKLVVCVLVIAAATILGMGKVIGSDVVSILLMGALGYVFGNGHGILSAKRNGYPAQDQTQITGSGGAVAWKQE